MIVEELRIPDVVGRSDDLLPRVRGQLPLREEPPDVVVEDLRRRPGHRPEAVLLAGGEELPERDAHLRGAVEDLHRTERVDVDARDPALHGVQEVEIEGAGEIGVDPALHAHLARPLGPCLLGPVGDLRQRERVRLRIDLSLGERAEPAPDVADVREVDVPVDHVGDDVADGLPTETVGDRAEARRDRRPPPGTARAPRRRRSRGGARPSGAPGGSPRRGAPAPPRGRPTPPSPGPPTGSRRRRRRRRPAEPASGPFANVRSIVRGFHVTSGSCQRDRARARRPSRARPSASSSASTGRRILPGHVVSGSSANRG